MCPSKSIVLCKTCGETVNIDESSPTRIDPSSDTWRVVVEYLQQQERVILNDLRRSGLDSITTENLRGRLYLIAKFQSDLGKFDSGS